MKADLSVMRRQAGWSSNKWLTAMTRAVKPCPICHFAVKSHKSTISHSRAWFNGWTAAISDLLLLKKIRTTAEWELIKSGKNQPQIMTTTVLPSPNTIPLNLSLPIEPIWTAAGQSVAPSPADRRRGGAWQLCGVFTGVWQQGNWHSFRRSIVFCPCQACSDLRSHVTRLPSTNQPPLVQSCWWIYTYRITTIMTATDIRIVSIHYNQHVGQ